MLPANPFLQTTGPRVRKALARLEKLIWSEPTPLAAFHAESSEAHRPFSEAVTLPLQKAAAPMSWGKLGDQKWYRLEIPAGAEDAYLYWPVQGECTAYIDGVPYYGFDIAHTHAALPAGTREVWIDAMCLENGIWGTNGGAITAAGCRYLGGFLVTRDDAAWEAYHDLWFLYEVCREEQALHLPQVSFENPFGYRAPLEKISVLQRRLLRWLENAVNTFDVAGLSKLGPALRAIYASLPASGPEMAYVATGHAHIDLVWMWTEKAAEAKAVHTFATMNRLMDVYPEFRFGYSQPASYAAVGRRSPALMAQVKRRIHEGRWEALGAAEVESDTNLSCGESLARSLIVGQRRFRELRGASSRTLWLPDVFGYCAALPQILTQTGVRYFFTTKLTWGTINAFPYSSFVWRGPDGCEVLAYVTQDQGYNEAATPNSLRTAVLGHRQSDVHPECLGAVGFGDGGGGTTEAMCERLRRAENLAGVPPARWGLVEEFFDRLQTRRAQLPVYQGELYLEYHRGVYTTISPLKAAYRACERALQTWESVRCALGGGEVAQEIWQRVIFTQFHDYIPGSSIPEVYQEGLPELHGIAADALAKAAAELSAAAGPPALWNPLPLPRVVWSDGAARRLEPLSGAPVATLPIVADGSRLRATPSELDNGVVQAGFDAAGLLTALTIRGEPLALQGPNGDFALYPDHPHLFDAWDIDRGTLSLGQAPVPKAECEGATVADGQAAVVFRRRFGLRSEVRIRYFLEVESPALRIDFEIDWQEEQTLLKVVFPTAYSGRFARFGAPFGSVLRSQQPGEEHAEAQWEVPASRYAIVMDDSDSAGLAVMTEAKYGFGCRSGLLTLSLVRSPEYPLAEETTANRRTSNLPVYSDLGLHRVRIALGRQAAGLARAEQPAALAELLFTRPLAYRGGAVDSGFIGLEGGESLQPVWAKPALDGQGWILRLHETLGRRGLARLHLRAGRTAELTSLLEEPGEAVPTAGISFTPYQLLSVRVR